MDVRITFRSEIFFKGDNIDEIRQQWENLPLFSAEALGDHYADAIEIVSVEDNESGKDLDNEFNSL